MATDATFADFVLEQMQGAGALASKKMFGEYAVYCDGKVVALLCNNQLFVKPTEPGRALLKTVTEAPPYPKAKPHWLIESELDDRELLSRLIRATAAALPLPKIKKAKAKVQ
jgi:TfoX/Sxy family transcriptional regulator of competence genes